MTTITIGSMPAAALVESGGLVEVRDASGAVIGFFASASMDLADKDVQVATNLYPSKSGEWRFMTTAEVLRDLEPLVRAK